MTHTTLPPQMEEWDHEKFSVEQGFDICTIFLALSWHSLKVKISEMSENDALAYQMFSSVCMGFETSAEWNKAIYKIKHIRKQDQRHLKLSEHEVFLCSIKLCEIHNTRFVEGSLNDLITRLKRMYTDPTNYFTEWSLWQKAIKDSFSVSFYSFSWEEDLRKPETEDIP